MNTVIETLTFCFTFGVYQF